MKQNRKNCSTAILQGGGDTSLYHLRLSDSLGMGIFALNIIFVAFDQAEYDSLRHRDTCHEKFPTRPFFVPSSAVVILYTTRCKTQLPSV